MSYWIMGTLAALMGLLGLFMAGAAKDAGILAFGLGLSAFGVLFCWFMIKTSFDEAERDAADGK